MNKIENKNPTEIEKAIEHFEERLRYAVTGGSTAISTVHARFALKVLKENQKTREKRGKAL